MDLSEYFKGCEDCFGVKVSVKPSLEFASFNEEIIRQNQKEYDKIEKQYIKMTMSEH